MNVSLVIPTLNAGELLEEVLAAVDRQPGAGQLERIAIDSGSTDGTRDRLERHGFAVTTIDKRDFSHGGTRDQAIESASGDVVVLLTQDATPADENWLAALLTAYEDPNVGAAYCKQLPRDDCNPFIARRLSEWAAGRNDRVVQKLGDADWDAMEPMARLQLCAYDNVAGSVRKKAWAEHRFGRRQFGEDVAFGKKLILSGQSIVFEPSSVVIHSHNRSPFEEGKRIYCDHQNLRDLFDVHLLPSLRSLTGAIRWGKEEYAKTVDALNLGGAEHDALHAWAAGYAQWAALGMYLGANSEKFMRSRFGFFFRWLDEQFHAGI